MSLHKSELLTKDAEKSTSDNVHSVSDVVHLGVKTIQATHKVYGKYSKWFLFIGYAIIYFSLLYSLLIIDPIDWALQPIFIHWTERLLTATLPSRCRALVTTVLSAPFRLRSRLLVHSFILTSHMALINFQLRVGSPSLPKSPTLALVERPIFLSVSIFPFGV